VKRILSEKTVYTLAGAAGKIVGIGDWRGQKGGPYGAFNLVGDDDKAWINLQKTEGRAAQLKAIEHPAFYDSQTEELLTWFEKEVKAREMESQLGGGKRKRNGQDERLVLPDLPVIMEGMGKDGQGNHYVGVSGSKGGRK
jgi:hypothetical protein